MATTLNGWPAITSSTSSMLRKIKIPGTTRSAVFQKDAAPLFAAFYADWQREMPKRMNLNPGPLDGWNYRDSRFTKSLSNHASGTAGDALYGSVLPADGQGHMTKEEKDILTEILSRYKTKDGHHVLANGEWWNVPHRDGMHTELSQAWDRGAKRNTTLADVREVIKLLKIDKDGNRPLGQWDRVIPSIDAVYKAEAEGIASAAAWRLAGRLADLGFYTGEPVRGVQKYPTNAVAAWQRSIGAEGPGKYGPIAHKKIFG
jgi:hypothetical protein